MRADAPWVVLADVCRVLEIVNVGNAAARLDDDERGSIRNPDATQAAGNPNVTIINESGPLQPDPDQPEARGEAVQEMDHRGGPEIRAMSSDAGLPSSDAGLVARG